jgi:hypothetical protein
LSNSQSTLRWIDNLVAELGTWRRQLAQGDAEALTKSFEEALDATARWQRAQETGQWTEAEPMEMPTMGTQFRRLLGFGGRDLKKAGRGEKRDKAR